jgi:serine phosphatase RsbU (regulator of sigma subunit)
MNEIRIEVWGIISLSKRQIMIFELLSLFIFIVLTVFLFSYNFQVHDNNPIYTFHSHYAKYFSLACTFLTVIEAQYFWSKFTQAQLDYIVLQNKKISEQNEKLLEQRKEILAHQTKIERQNRDITDSIGYAGRIQSILLPSFRKIERILDEHFIFFKPKDIVSGDFYWAEQYGDYSIVVVADCTGHGVPGAFVSVMGISFLSEIFLSSKANNDEIDSAMFLNKLKEKLVQSVAITESDQEAFDGMDISVCMIDRRNKIIKYSGALLSIIHVQNISNTDEQIKLNLIKPELHPISMKDFGKHTYKTIRINYNSGDMLYMMSDGYADQFGGAEGRKFLTVNLKTLLLSIANESMENQKSTIEEIFDRWKGDLEQVDDITLMGIRL